MSDYRFDTDYLEVGDTFEGGPIEQSYFIGAVMAAGGEVEIDGDKVVILQLPKSDKEEASKAKAYVADQKAALAPMEEPVIEKFSDSEEPPLVDLASEEAVVEEAPVPKKPSLQTRKPKAAPAPETIESEDSKDEE